MRRRTARRAVLAAIGAGLLAAAPMAAAPSPDVRGTVTFEGGAPIPAGVVRLRVEDPAGEGRSGRPAPDTRISSDGKAAAVAFSLSASGDPDASPPLEVVATLERADGWLIARGSTPIVPDSSVDVVLYRAMH